MHQRASPHRLAYCSGESEPQEWDLSSVLFSAGQKTLRTDGEEFSCFSV